jgi:hypothetical protein
MKSTDLLHYAESDKWAIIRAYRNQFLQQTDYAMLPDAPPHTQAEVDAIATYRQALRDLPTSAVNPDDIVFPELHIHQP